MPRSIRSSEDTLNGNEVWPIVLLYDRLRYCYGVLSQLSWGDRQKFGTNLSLRILSYQSSFIYSLLML